MDRNERTNTVEPAPEVRRRERPTGGFLLRARHLHRALSQLRDDLGHLLLPVLILRDLHDAPHVHPRLRQLTLRVVAAAAGFILRKRARHPSRHVHRRGGELRERGLVLAPPGRVQRANALEPRLPGDERVALRLVEVRAERPKIRRLLHANVGVELKGVRSGVERRRGRGLKAMDPGRRDAPGKCDIERTFTLRSPADDPPSARFSTSSTACSKRDASRAVTSPAFSSAAFALAIAASAASFFVFAPSPSSSSSSSESEKNAPSKSAAASPASPPSSAPGARTPSHVSVSIASSSSSSSSAMDPSARCAARALFSSSSSAAASVWIQDAFPARASLHRSTRVDNVAT
eukprot:29099-Pelagococcus_subviridis.AAC.4